MSDAIDHIGYIGMGIMGAPMARNLLQAGFTVTVWNRSGDKCEPLRSAGAAVADSPADLAARGPQVVCINVTDTPDVEDILFGKQGLISTAADGLIVIDHSTIDPIATQDFARRLGDCGVTLLDAPVSGGDVGAQNGTLSIMVGGEAAAFDRCMPLFQAVGKAITHVGESGMGQTCKACNQVAVAGTLLGTCEAIALAQKLGLNIDKMLAVVGAGAVRGQLSNLGPKIAGQDFAPGFMIDLVVKDLAIVLKAAKKNNLDLAGVDIAMRYFQSLQSSGGGRLGTQALYQAVATT